MNNMDRILVEIDQEVLRAAPHIGLPAERLKELVVRIVVQEDQNLRKRIPNKNRTVARWMEDTVAFMKGE